MGLGGWLQEQLFERRIVMLSGRLDADAATRAVAALIALDAGSAPPALRASVRVMCRGQVGGPAVGLVAAADHRVAAPHTRFHLAQPTARFTGSPGELAAQSRQQQDLLWRLYALVGRRASRPAEEVAEDMRRGRYLDASEALAYGLIDEVV